MRLLVHSKETSLCRDLSDLVSPLRIIGSSLQNFNITTQPISISHFYHVSAAARLCFSVESKADVLSLIQVHVLIIFVRIKLKLHIDGIPLDLSM